MAMMGSGSASGEGRAREAAEAAVSSPFLEDINLAGAHGILVNVTAGMDLSIGEFQEVGNIVKQFASEDATVVVGTVIDPDSRTGARYGRGDRAWPPGGGSTSPTPREMPADSRDQLAARKPDACGAASQPMSNSDYAALDKPTVQRQRAVGDGLRPTRA